MAIEFGVRFKILWLWPLGTWLSIPIYIASCPGILSHQHIKKLYAWLNESVLFQKYISERTLVLLLAIMILGIAVSNALVMYFLYTNHNARDIDFFILPLGGIYLCHKLAELIPITLFMIYFGTRGAFHLLKQMSHDNKRTLLTWIGFALVWLSALIQTLLWTMSI
jgi:hypothetical protein